MNGFGNRLSGNRAAIFGTMIAVMVMMSTSLCRLANCRWTVPEAEIAEPIPVSDIFDLIRFKPSLCAQPSAIKLTCNPVSANARTGVVRNPFSNLIRTCRVPSVAGIESKLVEEILARIVAASDGTGVMSLAASSLMEEAEAIVCSCHWGLRLCCRLPPRT